MSANLVNLVMDQLGSQAMGQIGSLLGEPEDKARTAVQGGVPALLGGLMSASAKPNGADNLLASLNNLDSGVLDSFSGSLSGQKEVGLMETGGGLLGSLLGGGMVDNLAKALTSFSGMGAGSGRSLLSLLTPLVLGVMKKQLMDSGGLNIGNLTSLLKAQGPHVAAAMPAGLESQLSSVGMGNLSSLMGATGGAVAAGEDAVAGATGAVTGAASNATSSVERTAANVGDSVRAAGEGVRDTATATGRAAVDTARDTASAGGSMMRWLIPLIVVIAALALLWNFFSGRNSNAIESAGQATSNAIESTTDAAGDTANAAADAADNAADAVGNAAAGAADAAGDAANAAGDAIQNAFAGLDNLSVGDINVGNQLSETFGSTFETLSGISDAESAQAAVPALGEATERFNDLASTVSELPAEGREQIADAATRSMTSLQTLVNGLYAVPGLQDILEGPVNNLMEAIAGILG